MTNKSKLLSGSIIYSFGSIFTQFIHIGFVKINTSILTTSEYGKYSLLMTTVGMLNVIVSLGIHSALTRFYKEYEDSNKLKNIAISFTLVWSLFIGSILFLIGRPLSNFLLEGTKNAYLLFGIVIVSVILFIFIEIYNVNYRMRFMAKKSVLITLSIAILNLLLLVILGIFFKLQILGVLLALFISRLLVFLMLFVLDLKNFRFIIEKPILYKMLHYGVGLMMGNISSWILTFIDRYFLKMYYDFNTIGIYSIGYKIGFMISPVFIIPFKKVFTPFQLEVYKQKRGKEKIKKMYRYYTLLGWFFVLCFAIFSKPMLFLIANKNYIEAYKIVPWVSISYLIYALTMFIGFGLHVAKKMFLNSGIITLASIINILLNIFLIPKYGMYGAVVSTILSYITVNILYFFISRRYWESGVKFMYPYLAGIPFLIVYFVYLQFISKLNNYYLEIPLSIGLISMYITVLLMTRLINFDEIKQISNYALQKIKKIK